jgi:O-glycosyl hydrolase
LRPGAKVVSLDNDTPLRAIAFANPQHEIVFVVLNTSDNEQSFTLAVGADARACRVPARAIQTHIIPA